MSGQSDREPCVVDAAPLSLIVRSFISAWNAERPPLPPRHLADGRAVVPFGAVAWLAQETGLRRELIEKLAAGKLTRTGLGTADLLLVAIGRQDLLGELPVQSNPHGGLRFTHPRSHRRVTYTAEIRLAGQPIGRVRRYGDARHYLAYDEAGRIVTSARSLPRLRRELVRRRFADSYCCGGSDASLTGVVAPNGTPPSLTG